MTVESLKETKKETYDYSKIQQLIIVPCAGHDSETSM